MVVTMVAIFVANLTATLVLYVTRDQPPKTKDDEK
tara:strand:- start:2338 stop:2442 length:105 start_codon:yes stop_codon:yes gene_type:complete